MFQQFDSKILDQFGANPADFLTRMTDFQRTNFDAARQIAENNVKAFQELAAIRDPQSFVTSQQAILQATIEKNVEILTGVWQALGVQLPVEPKKK